MRQRGIVMAIACVLGLCVTTGWAADAPLSSSTKPRATLSGCAARFAALDKDGDGIVNTREFVGDQGRTEALGMFQVRDRNHDGMLTVDELCPRSGILAGAAGPRFTLMDINHDGMVSKAEFMRMHRPGPKSEALFKSQDGDGDGKLSPTEFRAF
jgi:Ca2+-binding EF-hand superfamily protein